jgi:CHAT domain-containing protein
MRDESMKRSISYKLALVLSFLAVNGAASNEIAVKLLNRADSLYDLCQYDSAIVLGNAALGQASGADSLSGRILHQLGFYYSAKGMYNQADSLFQQALTIRKKALGETHPDVAETLREYAFVKRYETKLDTAKLLLDSALSIFQSHYGVEHLEIARTLKYLGVLHIDQGELAEAEHVLTKGVLMIEKLGGKTHPELASLLYHQLRVRLGQGKYVGAEELCRRALAIQIEATGEYHPEVATLLNILAIIYRLHGKHEEEEQQYERALRISEKTQGPNHPRVAVYLYNLALVYRERGRYAEAEDMLLRAIKIKEGAHGDNHPSVAFGLLSLAELYTDQGNYRDAETLYRRALDINLSVYGPNHYSVIREYQALGDFFRLTGNFERSLQYLQLAVEGQWQNFLDNFRVLSEKDALTYSEFLRASAAQYLSAYFASGLTDQALREDAGTILLRTKGLVSDGIFDRQKALVAESDPEVVALADEYSSVRHQIAQQYVTSAQEDDIERYRNKLDSLTGLAQELETELIRASFSYREGRRRRAIDCKSVTVILDDSTVLIEYVRYNLSDIATDSTEHHYLVIVFTDDGVELIQDLGEAAPIDSVIRRYQNHFGVVAESWPDLSADHVAEFKDLNDCLYATLWHPVERLVAGRRLVLVAPDGDLNLIAFGALRDDENRYLIEKYPLHYLTAGRDLVRLQSYAELGSGLLGIGDPDFDASAVERFRAQGFGTEQPAPNDQDKEVLRSFVRNNDDLGSVELWPLPYTRREVTEVSRIWQQTRNQPARTYFGAAASEDNFKREAPGKRVIHCASHGFFTLPANARRAMSDGESGDVTSDVVNPLLMSGIFLSGANLYGQGADSANVEDGLLTAYEVTGMNLNGTEWVVLSACESGLGEVKTGEGVYGLRRAFHMAGVRTVIVSLWPIPDKHTVSVMEQLYSSSENNLALTMQKIALQQIESIRRQNLPDHPFTWGAFIAVGDWRVKE